MDQRAMTQTTDVEMEYSPETPTLAADDETAELTCDINSCIIK